MKKRQPSSMLYLLVALGLIVIAIVTTAIINTIRTKEASADIRARAGVTNDLTFSGVVASLNSVDNTLVVNDLEFASESRSGPVKNYGTWTVTPPPDFNLTSLSPETQITISVNSKTFNITSHSLVATRIELIR